MHKTGSVIGLIAGVFAVLAAIVTLMFGGIASAFQAERASTVVGLGWGGIVFSFLVIVFAALSLSKSRFAGWGLILSAIFGAILGGTLVAIFMVLAFIGGILVVSGAKSIQTTNDMSDASPASRQSGGKGWLIAIVTLVVVIGAGGIVSMLGAKDQTSAPTLEATMSIDKPTAAMAVGASTEALAKLAQADVTGPEADKLTELGAAPPENQMAAFMRLSGTEKVTEAQQAARNNAVLDAMSKAKGTVVVWDMIINNVKSAGAGAFNISTKCADLANRVTPPAQIQMAQPNSNVLLTPRNPDERKVIERLAGCSAIKVKGVVAGFDPNTKTVELNPAIIIKADGYEAHDVKIVRTEEVPAVTSEVRATLPENTYREAQEKESSVLARAAAQPEEGTEPDDKRLHIVDTELNRVYASLMKSLPPDRRAELKQSEIVWIRKKEATCKLDLKCAIQFTEERLVDLSKF